MHGKTIALPILALLMGCTQDPDPSPSPTQGKTPTATATPAATATVMTQTPTITPEKTPTPSPEPPTPSPTATAEPTPTAAPPNYDLSAPVDVQYDAYGVPHIYSETLADALFTQGYVTAKDRIWQMDYLRRQAAGTRAEIMGEAYFDDDISVRMFDFRGWGQKALERYEAEDPELVGLLEAYSAGVNAWLDEAIAMENGQSLPPQIEAAGYIPAKWRPIDSLLIDKALGYGNSSSHSQDMVVWAVSVLLGPDITADLLRPRPVDAAYVIEDFYADFPEADPPQPIAPGGQDWEPPSPELRKKLLNTIALIDSRETMPIMAGSNNWVISGQYTESGYPILANDTHQGTGHPATYYQAHINTKKAGGDVDFVGYGYAGMPFFLFGHSDHSAYGLTNNLVDVSDVFQETVIGDDVLHNGQRVPLEYKTERFGIRSDGGSTDDLEYREVEFAWVPHHGPIFPSEVMGDLPVNLSAAWMGYSDTTLIEVTRQIAMGANFDDLNQAMGHLRGAAVNVVYADTEGNIGYTARTDIPIRAQLDYDNPPYMVVPGSGSHDWRDDILPDHLIPHAYNPEKGYVVTANNEVGGLLDDNDALNGPYIEEIDAKIYLSGVYDVGPRAHRIDELIANSINGVLPVTLDDNKTWQGDNQSRLARITLPYLMDAAQKYEDTLSQRELDAIGYLQSFADEDYRCTLESVGCVIYHGWLTYVIPDMLADETDPSLFENLNGTYMQIWTRPFIHFLQATEDRMEALDFQADGGCVDDPDHAHCDVAFPSVSGTNYFDNQDTEGVEKRDEILLGALSKAAAIVENYGGGALDGRTWGDVHTIDFDDPASHFGYMDARQGPYAIDAALFSVDVAGSKLNSGSDYRENLDAGGPSQRTVYEMIPGGIICHDALPGGQEERPGTPHFEDQVDLYINNQTRVLPFYEAEILEQVTRTLSLDMGFPSTAAPVWQD